MRLPKMNWSNQALLLLALFVIFAPSLLIYDYTQRNPRFCTSCHVMTDEFDELENSAMHDLTCHECHIADMTTNINHFVDVLIMDPQMVVKPAEMDNELCEQCHLSENPQWIQIVNTEGHLQHFHGREDYAECIDCHGVALHVFRPPEEGCLDCHDENRVHASETMDVTCVTCHDFIGSGNGYIPAERDGCITCHSGKEQIITSITPEAHIDSSCTSCHNPHEEELAKDCLSCHDMDEGLSVVVLHTDCVGCHVSHVETDIRETCESCHVEQREHFAPVDCTSCHN